MLNIEVQCLSDTLRMHPDSDDEDELTSRPKASIIDEYVTFEFGKPTKKYELKLNTKFVDAKGFREYIITHSIHKKNLPPYPRVELARQKSIGRLVQLMKKPDKWLKTQRRLFQSLFQIPNLRWLNLFTIKLFNCTTIK